MKNPTESKLADTILGEHLWALAPRAYASLRDALRSIGGGSLAQEREAETAPYLVAVGGDRTRRTLYANEGSERVSGKAVAVIPVSGTIFPRGSNDLLRVFGGVSLQETLRVLRRAVHDPGVGSVIADFDSNGGVFAGCLEAAAEIRSLRGKKPLIASVNYACHSAAYLLASSFDEVTASPSSSLGSIGIVTTYLSASKALENAGYHVQSLRWPSRKAECDGISPLSDEAIAYRMAQVKAAYDDFEAAVSIGRRRPRSMVAERFGSGRALDARTARTAGLCDRIMTFEALLAEHTSRDFERAAQKRAAIRDAERLAVRWGFSQFPKTH